MSTTEKQNMGSNRRWPATIWRGAVSIVHWLRDMLLRILLLVGMVIVFGAGVYLSWRHTYHLALQNGFSPDEAFAYTLFVEVILVVSEIVVIFRAMLDQHIAWQIYVGGGFGLIVNLTANILTLSSHGWMAGAMGFSITVGTAAAIMIMAKALVEDERDAQKSDSHEISLVQKLAQKLKRTNENHTKTSPQNEPMPLTQSQETRAQITHTDAQHTTTQNESSAQPLTLSQKNESSKSESETGTQSESESTQQTTSHKEETGTSGSHMSTGEAEALTFARKYYKTYRKLPTIKLIEESTNATQWESRKARTALKKQIERAS